MPMIKKDVEFWVAFDKDHDMGWGEDEAAAVEYLNDSYGTTPVRTIQIFMNNVQLQPQTKVEIDLPDQSDFESVIAKAAE